MKICELFGILDRIMGARGGRAAPSPSRSPLCPWGGQGRGPVGPGPRETAPCTRTPHRQARATGHGGCATAHTSTPTRAGVAAPRAVDSRA